MDPKRILIVDDDISVTRILKKIFDRAGYAATTVNNGEQALTAISSSHFHAMICDIQMPKMNGYQATREIRKFNKNVVIIAQTAFALTGDREKAIESGCNNHISKPIKQDELLTLIQSYFKK